MTECEYVYLFLYKNHIFLLDKKWYITFNHAGICQQNISS